MASLHIKYWEVAIISAKSCNLKELTNEELVFLVQDDMEDQEC